MQKQFISNHKFNQVDENTYKHWFQAHKDDFQKLHDKIAWVFSYILIFSPFPEYKVSGGRQLLLFSFELANR